MEDQDQPPQSCEYNGQAYANGTIMCQMGRMMRCMNGSWTFWGKNCNNPDGTVISEAEAKSAK